MKTYMGFKVIETPNIPKIQTIKLNDKVPMTDCFRDVMNKWLLDMFGEQEQIIVINHSLLLMSPDAKQKLSNSPAIFEYENKIKPPKFIFYTSDNNALKPTTDDRRFQVINLPLV
jgi:hypothetical protein